MFIEVKRLECSEVAGIRGILLIDGTLFGCTLEPPWKHNERNISCIPAGIYKGKKYNSRSHGKTLQVCDVINRSGILFHVGNTVEDTEGCILLAEGFAKSSVTISSSASAMARFRDAIATETTFTVKVTDAS